VRFIFEQESAEAAESVSSVLSGVLLFKSMNYSGCDPPFEVMAWYLDMAVFCLKKDLTDVKIAGFNYSKMEKTMATMDKSKIKTRILPPPEIAPATRIVNYFRWVLDPVLPDSVRCLPRIIPDLELILVVEGAFRYVPIPGKAVPVGPGDVLCILPNHRHSFQNCGGGGVVSGIHCELLPDASWAAGDYRLDPEPMLVTHFGADPAITALFQRCDAVFNGYGRYRAALLQTVVREVWLVLAEQWQAAARGALRKRTGDMVEYLRRHLTEPVSRQELARTFALTPQHVNALFRNELGISPTQFVNRERVLRAYRLIQNEGVSLKAAAAQVGFHDLFYFLRVFKKVTGQRPSQIR